MLHGGEFQEGIWRTALSQLMNGYKQHLSNMVGMREKGKGAYLKTNTKKRNPEVTGKTEKEIKICITCFKK